MFLCILTHTNPVLLKQCIQTNCMSRPGLNRRNTQVYSTAKLMITCYFPCCKNTGGKYLSKQPLNYVLCTVKTKLYSHIVVRVSEHVQEQCPGEWLNVSCEDLKLMFKQGSLGSTSLTTVCLGGLIQRTISHPALRLCVRETDTCVQ